MKITVGYKISNQTPELRYGNDFCQIARDKLGKLEKKYSLDIGGVRICAQCTRASY